MYILRPVSKEQNEKKERRSRNMLNPKEKLRKHCWIQTSHKCGEEVDQIVYFIMVLYMYDHFLLSQWINIQQILCTKICISTVLIQTLKGRMYAEPQGEEVLVNCRCSQMWSCDVPSAKRTWRHWKNLIYLCFRIPLHTVLIKVVKYFQDKEMHIT